MGIVEVVIDVMLFNVIDIFVMLKLIDEWLNFVLLKMEFVE